MHALIPNYFLDNFLRYDYTSYCMDVSKFPKPRFASEFGFQSYPSFRSWKNISTIDVSQE
jgi:beta-mannosidase